MLYPTSNRHLTRVVYWCFKRFRIKLGVILLLNDRLDFVGLKVAADWTVSRFSARLVLISSMVGSLLRFRILFTRSEQFFEHEVNEIDLN